MHGHIVVLQEESERVCGTALPVEIVWLILCRWGGLVSPSAMAIKTAPELREFKEWMDAPLPNCGRACLCHAPLDVGKPRMMPKGYSKEVWERESATPNRLNAKPQVGVVLRTRHEAWHITRRAFLSQEVVPQNDDWFMGSSCGRVELLMHFHTIARLGKGGTSGDGTELRMSGYVCDRPPERGIVWSLAVPIDEWWRESPYCVERGRAWWKPLIEVLQGQPMTTHMETRAEAWELYKRADRGEIV
jgi:hypothetical protein